MVRIIVDAMGGDNAPTAQVSGAVRAVHELGTEITLVGRRSVLEAELEKLGAGGMGIETADADDVITNREEPAKAVRSKRNASVVVAAHMLADGKGDAMLSFGSTGALLASGTLITGRIKGIIRPAIGTLLPSLSGAALLTDAGANSDCKAENLLQFGIMGSIYMEKIIGVREPKVGLVSNGEEEGKGNALSKAAYSLLASSDVNFIGNVEGRDILSGRADVFVTDGFTGNVVLKTVEGAGAVFGDMMKAMFTKNIKNKALAALLMKDILSFKKTLDYKEYGGAPLLGLKQPVIKGHGSSDAYAVFTSIRQAQICVQRGICDKISDALGAG